MPLIMIPVAMWKIKPAILVVILSLTVVALCTSASSAFCPVRQTATPGGRNTLELIHKAHVGPRSPAGVWTALQMSDDPEVQKETTWDRITGPKLFKTVTNWQGIHSVPLVPLRILTGLLMVHHGSEGRRYWRRTCVFDMAFACRFHFLFFRISLTFVLFLVVIRWIGPGKLWHSWISRIHRFHHHTLFRILAWATRSLVCYSRLCWIFWWNLFCFRLSDTTSRLVAVRHNDVGRLFSLECFWFARFPLGPCIELFLRFWRATTLRTNLLGILV